MDAVDAIHDNFPRAPKVCSRVATNFFDCFNMHAVKESDGDKGTKQRIRPHSTCPPYAVQTSLLFLIASLVNTLRCRKESHHDMHEGETKL